MRQFFKFMFASMLGFILANVVLFFLFFLVALIASAAFKGLTDKAVKVKPNSVLVINLDHPVEERTSKNPFEHMEFGSFEPDIRLGLNDLVKNIEKAKTDDDIKGIYLKLGINPNDPDSDGDELEDW